MPLTLFQLQFQFVSLFPAEDRQVDLAPGDKCFELASGFQPLLPLYPHQTVEVQAAHSNVKSKSIETVFGSLEEYIPHVS